MKKEALDLFCKAGGSSMGLFNAGFEVHGIDKEDQSEYPFHFMKQDIEFLTHRFVDWIKDNFDFVWASPPCQKHSNLSHLYKNRTYPDLIKYTRTLLLLTGLPHVIENVPTAPLRKDLMLCGTMFNLKVFRHRIFEVHGFKVKQIEHRKHTGRTGTHRYPYNPKGGYITVTGHAFNVEKAQKAMGINWMKKSENLAEAIPPVYSEYIGKQFLQGVADE